jgi:hypothetical protein
MKLLFGLRVIVQIHHPDGMIPPDLKECWRPRTEFMFSFQIEFRERALGFFVISQTTARYSIFVRSVVDLDSQLMFGLFIGGKGSEIILSKSENPCVGCQPRILHTDARFK